MVIGDTKMVAIITTGKLSSFIITDFFKEFIYLFERARTSEERDREREGGANTPLSREPDMGFNLRTLGSRPELRADA